ncbi:DNA damage-responsive transcriptional repressor RPH1 (JmjC domain-containing protein) [Seiridium cupressi]
MSAEATAEMAPEHAQIEVAGGLSNANDSPKPTTGLHSPPDSNNAMKLDGSDDSELSDLDDPEPPSMEAELPKPDDAGQDAPLEDDVKSKAEADEDIGEVLPDHWSGTVPVFKPDMRQFKDFKKFMEKIDHYGMKSGIVKIIPPTDWREKLPEYHDLVKQIKVREPIKQDIMGSNGTYRQVNILHQRSYNLPQWRQLCDQSEHQPPARRGERRANADKLKAPRPKPASSSTTTVPKGRGGRTTRSRGKKVKDSASEQDRPMTPVSPKPTEHIIESVEQDDPGADIDEDEEDAPRPPGRMGAGRQAKPTTQSTSARRKYSRREASARIDEEAFKDWDYNMDISDYTPERCEELERIYWKTLTYAPPLYGADLLGTLFSEDTGIWNLNKLPNLLDVLGSKIPGVNTAYLYLGMWKATFAWHLEDVDLYSINYLHFGAPKQWYSISQGDARRFETAMKSIWPTDAKACDQFLRHKAFLISPSHLQSHFNIKVNRVVSYPGEFVVTYPYGYHSGYNLGYNCAEAVNFALDSWLPMGRIAKKCECAQAQDSVWIDVHEIERKLRGESTDYEETEDEEDEEDEDEDEEDTLQSSGVIKIKQPGRKRKRATTDKGEKKAKKIRLRLRIKSQVEPPCCLCPNSLLDAELLPTDDGRKAHRMCALYGPETWIETVDGKEVVVNAANISKARLDLKCLYCRSKRGACFQCSYKKCARSYHATCAAAAGVFVEEGEVPIFGEDGTEYKEQAFEFSCRFHRTKREKKLDSETLDDCKRTREAAAALKKGDIAQLQYHRGEIFAGVVVENRHDEQSFLVEIIPNGCEAYTEDTRTRALQLTLTSDRVEVEWKWLLLPDPADLRLQKASTNAIPMPTSRKAKDKINATKRAVEELPRAQDDFVEGFTWAEFHTAEKSTNKAQVKVDLSKENQIWHYLGKTSTEARAQYTEDPRKQTHNSKSNFLDSIPRPPPPVVTRAWPMPYSTGPKSDRPYQYKPKTPVVPAYNPYSYTQQRFQTQPYTPPQYGAQQKYNPQPYTAQQFAPNRLAAKPFPTSTSTFAPQSGTRAPYTTQVASKSHSQTSIPAPKGASQLLQPGQAAPRSAQPHKPAALHSAQAHSRNKSLPFGTDPRYKNSSTYGSARYDKGTSSPFSYGIMQPPGLGATPSPQNGQVFQAQARERSSSAASTMSVTMPMTTSAIGPSSSASLGNGGQPQVVKLPIPRPAPPSVLHKYAFFQVHHNRDSTRYRTPYAPWGGFTNGYEGNLRAHLMKTPDALFGCKKQSPEINGNSTLPSIPQYPNNPNGGSANGTHKSPYGSGFSTPAHSTPQVSSTQAAPSPATPTPSRSNILQTATGPYDPDSVLTKLHPAIRAQYAAMLQRKQAQGQQHTATQTQNQASLQQESPAPPALSRNPFMQQSPPNMDTGSVPVPQRTEYDNHSRHGMTPPQPQSQPPHLVAHQVQEAYSGSSPSQNTSFHHASSPGVVQNQQHTLVEPPRSEPSTPAVPARPAAPKQTPVPPPRPWERLQRTLPSAATAAPPPAPVRPVETTTPAGPGALQPMTNAGPQPNNVSGPFWQTISQAMPNSNSLSPQPSFDPFQFINFQ